MKVLIFGDSQTSVTGKALAQVLRGQGDAVTVAARPGTGTDKHQLMAKSYAGQYDRYYLFTGGNNVSSRQTESIAGLLSTLGGSKVVVIGPPPATLITDVPRAKKVFGWTKSATAFFPKVANRREKVNRDLKVLTARGGGDYRDWRQFGLGGQRQPSGVTFPSQADGIHVRAPSSLKAAQIIASGGSTTMLLPIALGVLAVAAAYKYKRAA